MIQLFALLAAAGFALLVMLPDYKDRTKQRLSRGAGTSMFALGLAGIMFQILT